MPLRNTPIQRRLMTILLLTSSAVLLLTCAAFITYELVTFRHSTIRHLATLGDIVGANSTAALTFDNQDDATEILGALAAERHIVRACLYSQDGKLFSTYPSAAGADGFPAAPGKDGFRFENAHLSTFQPVLQGGKRLGTLYLQSDLGAIYERFKLYTVIVLLVITGCFLVAYALSKMLQKQISLPILSLAETARAISERRDYSVRAPKFGEDEVGLLTEAFNQMLAQIQQGETELRTQLSRLDLLHRITSAIGERQDLPSIFQVVVRSLQNDLPLDFGCMCLYDPETEALTVTSVGVRSEALANAVAVREQSCVVIDHDALARCLQGQLVSEPDISQKTGPFPQQLARGGLRALVAAPLLVDGKVFGVLLAARSEVGGFSNDDCEFLRQLSEHVALAAHQARLYGALQKAYDDHRETQHTVMQQERFRALVQMASGVAHDINNAISPVTLYTEALLEGEKTLSVRARDYLITIQRAIEDVAKTVARMREFYRQREPQLVLAPINLNVLIRQTVDLTRARWSDLPQRQGIVIKLDTELAPELPLVMGAEGEVRDALTNLVFNAVDAMPEGGALTVRTRVVSVAADEEGSPADAFVHVEVSDTGVGMDEETRRRCLEPFFTTKGERGTGLGLAMVYGMVERHSAQLEVESELRVGTTIRLVFAVSVPAFFPVTRPPSVPLPLPGLRILIVDDDPMLIKSLRDTLQNDGHLVTVADGGQAGIDAFEASLQAGELFEVVITDLGMPYVDGRKVAAAVKAAAAKTPVILLTGWGQRLVDENEVPPFVDRVLNKPPKLSAIRAALGEVTESTARFNTSLSPNLDQRKRSGPGEETGERK